MGHCLGLLHTFESVYGIEKINGSECTQLGDRVCDTPADPWVWNGILPCFSNNSCLYTGTCMDPNGSIAYTAPYSNIMSYWVVAGCNASFFSSGQFARVNAYLTADAGLQSTLSPSNLSFGPATLSFGPATAVSGILLKSAIHHLYTSGTVNLNNSINASFMGEYVTLQPGFTGAPASGKIIIKPAACNY